MKNLTLIVSVALLGLFVMQGCDKAHLQDITIGTKLQATKTQINVWEADTLLLTGASRTDSLNWTISPDGNGYLNSRGNAATVSFSQPGTYVITAQKPGGVPASITIKVSSNTPVVKSDTGTTVSNVVTSKSSDTLKIVPITSDIILSGSYYRTPAGDSVLVNISPYTYTTNKYCINGIIQYKSVLTTANNFNLNLLNIRESTGCTITTAPDAATSVSDVFKKRLLGFGTYPLTITLNGTTTYTGSITISAAHIVINWPYTSGVIVPNSTWQ